MGTNEVRLKKVQAAHEVVRGTGLAANKVILAEVMASYDKPLATIPARTGTYSDRQKGRAIYGREQIGFTLTDVGTYEDLPWHAEMAMKGGVSGVSDAGTPDPAYTRDYVPSGAVDDHKSATYEHGEPGNRYESNQVMTNSFTIRGDSDSDDEPAWMFEAEQMGLLWVPTAYTPALPILDTEPIVMRGTKLFIDDDTDPFGTTQLLDHLISFSITGNVNRHFKAFSENEFGYAPNKTGRGARTFDAQLVLEFDAAMEAEFAIYRQSVPVFRRVRLQREGSVIHTTVKKRAIIDIGGYWQSIAEGNREGNMTMTLGLAGYVDDDEGFDARLEIVNDMAALV